MKAPVATVMEGASIVKTYMIIAQPAILLLFYTKMNACLIAIRGILMTLVFVSSAQGARNVKARLRTALNVIVAGCCIVGLVSSRVLKGRIWAQGLVKSVGVLARVVRKKRVVTLVRMGILCFKKLVFQNARMDMWTVLEFACCLRRFLLVILGALLSC